MNLLTQHLHQVKQKNRIDYRKIFFHLCLGSLLIISSNSLAQRHISTYISPISPTDNLARYLAGWSLFINNQESTTNYGPIALITQVSKTFRAERINQCLFGDQVLDSKTTFTVSGSYVTDRNPCDWLAENFLLPRDYVSRIHTRPDVTSVIVYFIWYYGLDKFLPGLYVSIQAPFMHTRWDINWCELRPHEGAIGYDAGFISAEEIPTSQLFPHATAFFTGHALHPDSLTSIEPLKFSKISVHPLKKFNFASVQTMIGYNFWAKQLSHLGLFLLIDAPTGNRPKARYLFEPIIGNGHLWQLGIGATAHRVFWQCEESNELAGIYAAANIGHLFATNQRRVFDLTCKQQSRYMLAAQTNAPLVDQLHGNNENTVIAAEAQFKQLLSPIANLTASCVQISNSWQLDSAIMLSYTKNCFSWDLGYGFFARSKDQIKRSSSRLDNSAVQWVIKGDAQLYGFTNLVAIPLSSSESEATIYSGTNLPMSGASTTQGQLQGKQNNSIDNPEPAIADPFSTGILLPVTTQSNNSTQINTSIQPRFITAKDIDISSAKTRIYISKIFGQLTQQWPIDEHTIAYIGFGAEVQLGPRPNHGPIDRKSRSVNTGLTAWNIWLKGGIDFGLINS